MSQEELSILSGIRVIDSGVYIAGVGAGALLGELGAEVIKIEDPVRGDSYRGAATLYGDAMSAKGRHLGFETTNMNKKGITLNLKNEKGREILYQLVAKSDVFYTNFLDRILGELGITYEILKKYNPMLIYGRSGMFGFRGHLRNRRGFDTVAQAYSGAMWTMGDRDYDEPMGMVGAPFDNLASTMMACGIIGALLARERLGIGQEVHTSLLGSALHLQKHNVNMTLLRGRPNRQFRRKKSPNPITNNYRCRDGKWIMLAEPFERFWEEFCNAIEQPQLKDDPRFSTHLGGRSKNNVELIQILDEVFSAKSRDEWIKTFEEKNVQFGYAPIYDLAEAVEEPQVVENEYVTRFNHPVFGDTKIAGFPFLFSQTPARIYREAPEHGQHTEEVLMEVLGYSWDDIAKLKDEGII